MMTPMHGSNDLVADLPGITWWRPLWAQRWLVVAVTVVSMAVAGVVAHYQPDVYQASVLLAPTGQERSALPMGLMGGLGALAGISAGGGDVDEHLAVLRSHQFIWSFATDKHLLPVLFPDRFNPSTNTWNGPKPGSWDVYRLVQNRQLLGVSMDRKSGLVTVRVQWTDPTLAADWANRLVTSLNDSLRQRQVTRSEKNLSYLDRELRGTQLAEMRQALFKLITAEQKKAMLARTQQEFAFRVLDPAIAPDQKLKPRRLMIVAVAGIIGAALALLGVLSVAMAGRFRETGRV